MDAFVRLSQSLVSACNEQQLPDPFKKIYEKENYNLANSATYIRALNSWLVSLGYLEEHFLKKSEINDDIKAAVNRFQREAGFIDGEIDSWAGPRTKEKLRQLVSFEFGQDLNTWGKIAQYPHQYPAVIRAVYLRLYVLGFLDDSLKIDADTIFSIDANVDFHRALSDFLTAAYKLGLTDGPLATEISFSTLKILFEQDNLVRALSDNPGFLAEPSNASFVRAIGWVELWLLGYDVDLRRHIYDPDILQEVDDTFKKNYPDKKILTFNKIFSCDFFLVIRSLTDVSLYDCSSLEKAIVKHNASLIEKMKKLATGVWDGIKRLWSWFKNKLSELVGLAENEIWGLARIISNSARKTYEIFLKSVDIVHRGSVYLRQNAFPGSDIKKSFLQFNSDFDANFFSNDDYLVKYDLIEQDANETKCFVVSCRIFSLLSSVLIDVTKSFSAGALSWFILMVSLSRTEKQIRELFLAIDSFDASPLKSISIYENPVK